MPVLKDQINIYPNLGNGEFIVSDPLASIKTIEVYNQFGVKVNNPFGGNQSLVVINLTLLPQGMYQPYIITDTGIANH